MLHAYRNCTGGLVGNGPSLEPPSYPDNSDAIDARIRGMGFSTLRELCMDYRYYVKQCGPWFGGFRAWLRETIDRQIDEEAAKSWEDRHSFHTGDY